MKIGLYSGTFDPLTNGHLDIIVRSSKLCDKFCDKSMKLKTEIENLSKK